MSYPKNNVKLILVDVPLNSFDDGNSAKILYLPICQNEMYSNKFESVLNEFNLYLRVKTLPKVLKKILAKLIFCIKKSIFFIISEQDSKYLPSFEELTKCYAIICCSRTDIDEWLQLIQDIQKWKFEDTVTGRLLLLTSFLLSFACSEKMFKKQYHLM